MDNALTANLDRLHTTVPGAERIKRNLGLTDADPVQWCRAIISDKRASIVRRGKNWYIQAEGCIITVNAGSYTIITAHRQTKRSKAAMTLETDRLILRRWEESDAADLYECARDPAVGPIAGWPPHQSVSESRNVILTVFGGAEAYAVCLKSDNRAIGAIELKLNGCTDMTQRDDECELGYWLGRPFWGRGLMPEAAAELLRRAFEDLGMSKVWCGYYEGNTRSRRVQEKLGFKHRRTDHDTDVPLLRETRTSHVSCLTKEEWEIAKCRQK